MKGWFRFMCAALLATFAIVMAGDAQAAVVRTAVSLGGPRAVAMLARISPPRAKASREEGYRARGSNCVLYLPQGFHATNGSYDVILHFHGMPRAQEVNLDAAHLNAAIVSVNLGIGSDPYEKAYREPRAFDALLATTERLVRASGKAPGAQPGRVALSAWSAGFGAVSAILKNEASRRRVDAVLLADGLHTMYRDRRKHVLEERSLEKYVDLASAASHGDKLFVVTHSSIPTYGYASSTETVGALLRMASIEQGAPPAVAPRKMKAKYQVNRGGLHVTGYEGRGVQDHLDHIWAMGQTMFPLLAERWQRT